MLLHVLNMSNTCIMFLVVHVLTYLIHVLAHVSTCITCIKYVSTCMRFCKTCIKYVLTLFFSLTLGTNLRASVARCLNHYLTHGLGFTTPSTIDQNERRRILKEWLAPWGKGLLGGFPANPVSSMLAQSAAFTPHLGLIEKNTSVFSPTWRGSVGVMKSNFADFSSYKMRQAMKDVIGEMEFHPLWLLMTISFNAGIFNPMLGYAENASWWHQVPPFMEALITYEIAVALDDQVIHKTGKVVDRRVGNILITH